MIKKIFEWMSDNKTKIFAIFLCFLFFILVNQLKSNPVLPKIRKDILSATYANYYQMISIGTFLILFPNLFTWLNSLLNSFQKNQTDLPEGFWISLGWVFIFGQYILLGILYLGLFG